MDFVKSGVDHDEKDEPGRRLIYMQMIEVLTAIGDKVIIDPVALCAPRTTIAFRDILILCARSARSVSRRRFTAFREHAG